MSFGCYCSESTCGDDQPKREEDHPFAKKVLSPCGQSSPCKEPFGHTFCALSWQPQLLNIFPKVTKKYLNREQHSSVFKELKWSHGQNISLMHHRSPVQTSPSSPHIQGITTVHGSHSVCKPCRTQRKREETLSSNCP